MKRLPLHFIWMLSCWLFACGDSPSSNTTTEDTNTTEAETQSDESPNTSSSNTAPLANDDKLYAWVDKLNIRGDASTKAKVVASVEKTDALTFTGNSSPKNDLIVLRGVAYDAPWYQVTTPDGTNGWVFGGAVKRQGETKGNEPITDTVFDYPHFGAFDLNNWKKKNTTDESGGDAEINTNTYEKGGQSLAVSLTEVGEYGYSNRYVWKDTKGNVIKERQLEFSIDPFLLTETVKVFNISPAKQYQRSQKLSKHFMQLNARPMMVNGEWSTQPLVETQTPKGGTAVQLQHISYANCNSIDLEDSGCSCSFRPDKSSYDIEFLLADNQGNVCINLGGQQLRLKGKRTDNRAMLKSRSFSKHWIVLPGKGAMTFFGETVNDKSYEQQVEMLVQTLLVMDKIPNEIPIKNDSQGMAIREVRDLANDAIATAKKRRKAGDHGAGIEMQCSNNDYNVILTSQAKGKNTSGVDTFEGNLKVIAKDGSPVDSRQVWGDCDC